MANESRMPKPTPYKGVITFRAPDGTEIDVPASFVFREEQSIFLSKIPVIEVEAQLIVVGAKTDEIEIACDVPREVTFTAKFAALPVQLKLRNPKGI